jgi:hypothetical protein
MDNVQRLPVWKKDATTSERLYELARDAAEHPEQYVEYIFINAGGESYDWAASEFARLSTALGLLELVKADMIAGVRK